ncbi:DUF4286 family protein [Mesonia sp. K7]|uniref:DUF4286 family protein n=1 Tax=Mesonia sp. K7 TaxID=2218606 RepID=UPI000DA8C857|nr:DUF4286 family protein [Mesonia sp. K7]PZD78500.1 DUF4286 domain-containing protein [Mesonia sp. K7]
MHIYNVTINVNDEIHQGWLDWMKNEHIPKMLQTGKFTKALMTKVLVEEQMGGTTYSVQYTAKDKATLDTYYKENAAILRNETVKKFGDQLVAFRTELEVVFEL